MGEGLNMRSLAGFTVWKNKIVPFGKHKGSKLGRVVDEDFDYIYWAFQVAKLNWFVSNLPLQRFRDALHENETNGWYVGGPDCCDDDHSIGGFELNVDWYK